jgi:hypothetical protein
MAIQNQCFEQSHLHPGVILSEKLIEMGMSAGEFAQRIGQPENVTNAILYGKKAIFVLSHAIWIYLYPTILPLIKK